MRQAVRCFLCAVDGDGGVIVMMMMVAVVEAMKIN